MFGRYPVQEYSTSLNTTGVSNNDMQEVLKHIGTNRAGITAPSGYFKRNSTAAPSTHVLEPGPSSK